MIRNIRKQYHCKEEACVIKYETIVKDTKVEKEIIEKIKRSSIQAILLAIHSGKQYKNLIWKEIN